MQDNGLITISSAHSAAETLDRLEGILKSKGVNIFARVDHAAGAALVGLELRPTQLLIFGNPKAGTPLMQADQTVGLDLPLKVLAWEDADGKSWLTIDDVAWLAERHGLGAGVAATVDALNAALRHFAHAAAS